MDSIEELSLNTKIKCILNKKIPDFLCVTSILFFYFKTVNNAHK